MELISGEKICVTMRSTIDTFWEDAVLFIGRQFNIPIPKHGELFAQKSLMRLRFSRLINIINEGTKNAKRKR
jgi:hypothetical protein